MNLPNRRILLIDDMPSIHEDFRKILSPSVSLATAKGSLDAAKAALFGDEIKPAEAGFELDSAYQGQEGLDKVQESLRNGLPYAMAFVDMRMPPGWDGAETVERLWQADPRLQVVICTAYSDTSWEEVLQRLDARDRLLILKKPFDTIEVRQLANALTAKWALTQQAEQQIDDLEAAVQERTRAMLQSEKLASIGQLAAGVAHEINNPIGYIFSNFGMLEEYLGKLFEILDAYERAEAEMAPPALAARLRALREGMQLDFLKEDVPGLMQESREGIVRVRTIVQDLKDFSRVDSTQEWQLASLHQGIDSTLNVVASEVRYKADVVKEYGSIPEIECLPSQVNQVIMNLVVNAAHRLRRRQRVAGSGRHRQRHPARGAAAHLRPLLHHQADRQGHGAGAVAVLRHRAEAPRPHRGAQRGRHGHHLPRRAAGAARGARTGTGCLTPRTQTTSRRP
jgi:signal transduction histidine kinase